MRSAIILLFIFTLVLSSTLNGDLPLAKGKAWDIKNSDNFSAINSNIKYNHRNPSSLIFAENFTGSEFPPAGWQAVQTNTGYTGTNPCFWSRFTSPGYLIRSSPAACGLWWSYQNQDEWLISPEITLTGGVNNYYYLQFWTYGFCGSPDSDHYYVKISTDNGAHWTVLYDLSGESRGWNRYEEPVLIDLSAYANQTIRLAWHAEDGPANQGLNYVWFIDDIEVGTPFEHDVGVVKVLAINRKPLRVEEPDTFWVRIFNFGFSNEDNVLVKMTANDQLVGKISLAIDALSYRDTCFVWAPNEAGNYTLKFFTELAPDQNQANDTIFALVPVAPAYVSVPYFKDFDEDWGPFGNNPPTDGWEIIDYGDEHPKRWNRNDWYKSYIALFDREVAMVNYKPIEHQDDWLVSPRINCSQDTQYTLSFWHQYEGYRGAVPDTGYLLLSTDGGESWQVLAKYCGGQGGVISSGYQNFNLTGLVSGSSNVKVAFRYYAYNAGYWTIDDFAIIPTPNIDVCPVGIECPQIVSLGETLTARVIVKNTGRSPLNPGWYITYAIDSKLDSVLVPQSLDPGDSWQFSFNAILSRIDTFTITVETKYPDDEYPINNILTRVIRSSGWQELRPMPSAISGKGIKDGGALVSFGDSLFALRGCNSNEFYVYFTASDSWASRRPIGFALKPDSVTVIRKYVKGGGALTRYQNKLYAFKGGNTSEFWSYLPGLDSWVRCRNIPKFIFPNAKPTQVKSGGALVTYQDSIYAFKGGNTSEFWLYIPAYDSWAPRCSIVTPTGKKIKGGAALAACGDTIYAFVGGGTNYFYAYLPQANCWIPRAVPSFDNPTRPHKAKVKDGASLAVLNGKIYAFRGGNTKLFGYYDPVADTWYRLENIPGLKRVKAGAALAACGDKLYAFKGGNTSEFWSYTPQPAIYELNAKHRPITSTAYHGLANTYNTLIVSSKTLPNQNSIYWYSSQPARSSIKIYDVAGKLLGVNLQTVPGPWGYRLALPKLSSGIYYLHHEDPREPFRVIKLVVVE
ncbi:MAG: choice-of-anchor J domain-containing protein [candidate division WOR-3 bacterium]